MINPLLSKGRFLFVVNNCPYCLVWKEFIDRINLELAFDKMIRVIDCSEYYEFGISNSIIKLFDKYVQGQFPVLFVDGIRKDGTHTVIEAEAWLRAFLHDDFEMKKYNPYMWNKDCKIIKKGLLRNKLLCGG